MFSASAPIGVLDTGIGGYTVVKELQALLPNEDFIFFGDGANTPYGNRTREDILHLTCQSLRFLASKQVKAVAIACNTISALIDDYRGQFPFPIFSVVQAGADDVAQLAPASAIVLSTVFTATTGCYAACVGRQRSDTQIIAQGSPLLAALVERGDFHQGDIGRELQDTLGVATAAHPKCDTLVLGCTHYPLIQPQIEAEYPQFRHIINPAHSQAAQIRRHLEEHNLLNPQSDGHFTVYTSGDCQGYLHMAEVAKLRLPDAVEQVAVATPL